jgi:hypothetical protein
MPEPPETDFVDIARGFRGSRGKVLVRELVQVQAAGGPAPAQDWRAIDLTPDLSKALLDKTPDQARDQINAAFGILPGLNNKATTGPMVREAQHHLASWTLQPMARQRKPRISWATRSHWTLCGPYRRLAVGGGQRTVTELVKALAEAKAAGVDGFDVDKALTIVNWGPNDGAA